MAQSTILPQYAQYHERLREDPLRSARHRWGYWYNAGSSELRAQKVCRLLRVPTSALSSRPWVVYACGVMGWGVRRPGERAPIVMRAIRRMWEDEVARNAFTSVCLLALEKGDMNLVSAWPTLAELGTKPKEKKAREELSKALVEKRRNHAEHMLAKAQQKLRIAERLVAKWGEKVKYYDRTYGER